MVSVSPAFAFAPGVARAARTALRDESGSELVEMALSLNVLFLLVFAFMNLSSVMFGVNNVAFGTRQAIRYACLHSSATSSPTTKSGLDTYLAAFEPKFPSNTVTTALTYNPSGSNVVGSTVTYQATMTFNFKVPLYTFPTLTLTVSSSGYIIQ